MFSAILGIILLPAILAFVLGFMAHFFKTQAERQPEVEPSETLLIETTSGS